MVMKTSVYITLRRNEWLVESWNPSPLDNIDWIIAFFQKKTCFEFYRCFASHIPSEYLKCQTYVKILSSICPLSIFFHHLSYSLILRCYCRRHCLVLHQLLTTVGSNWRQQLTLTNVVLGYYFRGRLTGRRSARNHHVNLNHIQNHHIYNHIICNHTEMQSWLMKRAVNLGVWCVHDH